MHTVVTAEVWHYLSVLCRTNPFTLKKNNQTELKQYYYLHTMIRVDTQFAKASEKRGKSMRLNLRTMAYLHRFCSVPNSATAMMKTCWSNSVCATFSPTLKLWTREHVYSLKAEINTENTINKKVKVKLYTKGQNKKNTNNTQILASTRAAQISA